MVHLLREGGAWLLGWVPLAVILLAIPDVRHSLAGLLTAASYGDGSAIRNTLRSYGPLAPVVSIALILLHAVVPLPAELLVLANGLAFGFWGGLT